MARSYPYGKVPASKGTVITESFERPMVDCGYCSTQFAARTARAGVSANGKSEGHRIRALGGRAHWAGSNASEQRTGAKKALNVALTGIVKGAVLNRLKAGYAVTISLSYIKLPGYLKQQTNDFGHCTTLFGYRREGNYDYVGFFDPLWVQGSQGTWARWVDIDQALWDGGHNTTTVKYVPPPPPVKPPPTASAEEDIVTTPAKPMQVSVPKGAKMYTYSDFRSDPANVTSVDPARMMPLAGYTKAGDLAVGYVPTGTPPATLTIKYMRKAEATVVTYPPTGGPTPDQTLAIRKAEYQRVVTGSIIQSPKAPE